MATKNARRSKRSSTPQSARSRSDTPSSRETFFTTEDEARRSEIRYLIREELDRPTVQVDMARIEKEVAARVGVNPLAQGENAPAGGSATSRVSPAPPAPSSPQPSRPPKFHENTAGASSLIEKLCTLHAQMLDTNTEMLNHSAGSNELQQLLLHFDNLRRDYLSLLEMYRGVTLYDATP